MNQVFLTVTKGFDSVSYHDLIDHIKSANNCEVQIYGSERGLSNLIPSFVPRGFNSFDENKGYFVKVDGIQMNCLENALDNVIFIIPENGKEQVLNQIANPEVHISESVPQYGIYTIN